MHQLLELQTKRFLPKGVPLPPEWDTFLAAVGSVYSTADADRQWLTRSLEVSSKEVEKLRRDLDERRLAEAQLEHLLSLLGATLESTADGIMVLDKNGRLVRFNQRFAEMWRIPDDVAAFWGHDRIMECICAQIKPAENFAVKMNYLYLHPEEGNISLLECIDGRLIESNSLPHTLGGGTVGRVFSFRDITERKLAEEALQHEKEEQRALIMKLEAAHNQLLQSEKMASIGQLAAGVAHEINNPIGYVNSNLGSLGQYVESLIELVEVYERIECEVPVSSLLEEVRAVKQRIEWEYLRQDVRSLLGESAEGIARVRQIVQDLKDFSHVDQAEWQVVDLHKGIDSTLNIIRNEIKYNSEVIKEYGDIPLVECMASQVNQVFMNMLVNASHAIGEGNHGKITIRTGAENGLVWAEFTDTGMGIAPENLKRIFDPFFTTKPVGKGTGLGLSLSFGIIEKHHGRIEVQSELGKGATFRIWLPVERIGNGEA